MMEGEAILTPEFCYNRVTDFTCYMWIEPQKFRQHDTDAGADTIGASSASVSSASGGPGGGIGSDSDSYMASYWDTGAGWDSWPSTTNNQSGNQSVDPLMSGMSLYDYDMDYDFGLSGPERTATEIINNYMSALWLLCGSFGNVMSFAVMHTLSKEAMSTCIYLVALCFLDLTVLYTRCGNDWLRNVGGVDINNMLMMNSQSACKVYPFTFSFIFQLSRWLLVCIAIEGVVAARWPQQMQRVCSRAKAEAVMLLLTVLLICINIHYFWTFELDSFKDPYTFQPTRMCTFIRQGYHHSQLFQSVVWPLLDLAIAEVLPYSIVLICAVTMTITIGRGQHRGNPQHRAWRERYQMDPGGTDQLKVTLLVTCVAFLVCTLPKFGFNVFKYRADAMNLFLFEQEAQLTLIQAVTSSMEYFFLSCKFLLYAATSRKFRTQFKRILKCSNCQHRVHEYPTDSLVQSKPMMDKSESTRSAYNLY